MKKLEKIYLDKELLRIWQKIEFGENITFLRYADGERAIMTGQAVKAQEGGWASPDYIGKLGKDLLSSLELVDNKVYYAISCPCCDNPAYYWYSTRIKNKNITFANLWINANYQKFIKKFELLNREAVIVANYRSSGMKIGNLKILKHYSISDDCFQFWDEDGPKLIENIKNDFGNKKNILYVISAGPMSEPIIAELFKNNPDNCYIDFGSSIDKYYRGKMTRPYENKKSVYGKRNCWMYNPSKISFDVSVVLTLYKRPEKLLEQLDYIDHQTLKPKEILLFQDATDLPQITLSKEITSRITNYIKVDKNVGVWGRFAVGLLATSKYICFFDDDTIPGNRWLENCHTQILKKRGLYGTIGIDSWNFSEYPYSGYRRWGWDGPCHFAKKVDFVGHSWFLEKDWLGVMWINNSNIYSFKYVGEDMFLSYSLKKWLGIKTYVPPHPISNTELYGSIPDKALKYGQDKNIAIGYNSTQLENMNKAIKILISRGLKNRFFRKYNLINKEYLEKCYYNLKILRKKITRKLIENIIKEKNI